MNLHTAADAEKERRTRSKLEPHREAIFALRRKHWTYREIAKWLNDRGIPTRSMIAERQGRRKTIRRERQTALDDLKKELEISRRSLS